MLRPNTARGSGQTEDQQHIRAGRQQVEVGVKVALWTLVKTLISVFDNC